MKTRIVLADDHPIVLEGLRNLIGAEKDFELAGTATNGSSALKMIRDSKPDVAVLDISMPDLNGIVLARRLQEQLPQLKLMILTSYEERAYLLQAVDAGVSGYVLKRSAPENLVPAIRSVLNGGLYVDPAIAHHVVGAARQTHRNANSQRTPNELTDRERDVLKLCALGYTNKEIANRLAIGIKSIETYKARGTEKLDVKTRAELVRYAAACGWLSDI